MDDLTTGQYQDLAEFRRQIREFLYFSEQTARTHGIEPQQHQFLLAVRGLPDEVRPTVRELASRLFIQHHSAVELINRLEARGAIVRLPGHEDKREVLIRLTAAARTMLRQLAIDHREELERSGPALAKALRSVLRNAAGGAA